ncbi:hypothetical protein QAD02_005961 [Eretmocerus hayati]|uniref:Uncharacterized protein n=1 Tax=Eretmocerus hayati TaxID=131215 RepID=A0ACC2MZR6_9HYME|nr:hypothetical protein QAD02_005961 [Eretmocerus hayati]
MDGNTKTEVNNRKELGVFCGESEQPQTFISETSFVRVLFHTDNFTDQTYFSFDSRAEQQFEVYLRYGAHPELYPNRRGEIVPGTYCERSFKDCRLQTCYVQSPAYPGIYPRALHCKYRLNVRQPFIKLYIENEEFNIDGQRCENIMTCPMRPISSGAEHCPYDYIRIYDGLNETAPVIGTFCGMGKFPYSIIGTGSDLYVEFVSSAAGPLLNTGFHFNVGNWPGHVDTANAKNGSCDWVLSSEGLAAKDEGIFLSVAHWYPPHTSCTYLLKGRPGEVARLYFPSFRVNRIESPIAPYEGDCAESLTLYDADWADDARIIKTFCDTFSKPMEKHDFVSTSSSLFVRFESKTGSYSGSSLYYWAHYDFFNATRFGEPVPGTECDELFSSWKSRQGTIRSPLNTLLYKRPGDPPSDLTCTYSFVTDRRLYARVIVTLYSVAFKEHPYAPCGHCWDSRADRLFLYEPMPNSTVSLHHHDKPIQPATDGELEFPHYDALSYVSPPRSIKCIWELRVNPERDLWLHFVKTKFASRSCEDGKLEIYLPSSRDPYVAICGENVSSAKEMPILTAAQIAPASADQTQPGVSIQFVGSMALAKAEFKIAWTELFHLPRDASGKLNTAKLEDCAFHCPGDAGCIPERLLCNGVVNCPKPTPAPSHHGNSSKPVSTIKMEPDDEASETCAGHLRPLAEDGDGAESSPGIINLADLLNTGGWTGTGLAAALALVLGTFCLICVCRCCRKGRPAHRHHLHGDVGY